MDIKFDIWFWCLAKSYLCSFLSGNSLTNQFGAFMNIQTSSGRIPHGVCFDLLMLWKGLLDFCVLAHVIIYVNLILLFHHVLRYYKKAVQLGSLLVVISPMKLMFLDKQTQWRLTFCVSCDWIHLKCMCGALGN